MKIKVIASGSSGNATLINDGKSSLLLDAGVTIKELQRGTGFMLSNIAGCLVTHAHADHSKACKDIAKRGISIYSSQGTFDSLNVIGHRFIPVRSLNEFKVGTFIVRPFDVVHDVAEPLGFLVNSSISGEKLVYFCDTAYVKYSFSGLDYIVAECNHGDRELRESVKSGVINAELAKRITRNHLSLERFIAFLKATDLSFVKEIHVIHLSDNNSNAERFKQEIQRIAGTEVYIY